MLMYHRESHNNNCFSDTTSLISPTPTIHTTTMYAHTIFLCTLILCTMYAHTIFLCTLILYSYVR